MCMFAYMYEYFSATWLIEHNQERCKVRNVNSSWESGTKAEVPACWKDKKANGW